MDAMLAEDEATWGAAKLEAMGQHGALRNLCDAKPAFAELLAGVPFGSLLDQLLGEGYVLHSFDGLVMLPGTGRFPWDFHNDVAPLVGVAFGPRDVPAINCLYYVDDVTEENGATWIVPASQHACLRAPSPAALAELAFQALGSAGDVLMFDGRLWHCAGLNRSTRARHLIKMMFCRPWLRPQMDYARAVREEVLSQLDERTRRWLGVGISPPASVTELRAALARKAGGE
jgi:ectoine hydroxylase-related dioxygenase (phytanoyl-CoA dioxygenase family)